MNGTEFRSAFAEHKDAIYRFAWRMTNSPTAAEDVVQEAFLALLRHPGRFDVRRGQLRSFLLGVARNVALKRWREENRWDAFDDNPSAEQLAADPVDLTRAEAAQLVGDAVRALPPLQREVLVLAQYEGLSLEEIARMVEAEVGTVKARLHRARENLKRALAPLRPANGRNLISNGTPERS
ncbi:MAG TPA: RNA polymerase sigma factor [Bryobacteraceae bacterium]|jgi:RNA polymerase sigma-70 factor (ECF subfamily)